MRIDKFLNFVNNIDGIKFFVIEDVHIRNGIVCFDKKGVVDGGIDEYLSRIFIDHKCVTTCNVAKSNDEQMTKNQWAICEGYNYFAHIETIYGNKYMFLISDEKVYETIKTIFMYG